MRRAMGLAQRQAIRGGGGKGRTVALAQVIEGLREGSSVEEGGGGSQRSNRSGRCRRRRRNAGPRKADGHELVKERRAGRGNGRGRRRRGRRQGLEPLHHREGKWRSIRYTNKRKWDRRRGVRRRSSTCRGFFGTTREFKRGVISFRVHLPKGVYPHRILPTFSI